MRIIRNNRLTKVLFGVFLCVMTIGLLLQNQNTNNANAASLEGFDPGYIISDWQMGNYNSMNEGEIQAFLASKNPCGNRDYNYYVALARNTNYQWHFENGHFICLSEERFGHNDNEIGFQYGESAAHIIWQAAQDYRINPQVLLVLLQKETGLITDPIPNNGDYRKATGFGCPDTAACSSKYYGFKNQIRNAAALFRTVLDGGWTNYPLGDNYIQYNPNAACGGSVVNVRSLATSALYRYTPYQPNAGAIAAGYGTASCGAYGNRNFYLYFEDWFGGINYEKPKPTIGEIMKNMTKVQKEVSDLELEYSTHIEDYGWLGAVSGGEMAGTSGYSLRVEAFSLKLTGMSGIEYRSHIQDLGWEDGFKHDGEISGTTGQSKRMEAIQIKLSDELAMNYDVVYRVHVQNYGWMDWKKNGEIAGTTGEARRIEAIQIKVIRKALRFEYSSHVENYGWMDWKKNGEIAGTTGEAKRMEAINIRLADELSTKYNIQYRVHVQDYGWMDWKKNGEIAGTTGEARRIEAIEIRLEDETLSQYSIKYRVHVQDYGWTDWKNNGEMAGTTGESKRMEAIEIRLEEKKQ